VHTTGQLTNTRRSDDAPELEVDYMMTLAKVGGSRFGFWSKKTVKFDINEPLMQEHFEYVEFLYKK
jgi:hypothetical protein